MTAAEEALGVDDDATEAERLLKRAAALGHKDAQFLVAMLTLSSASTKDLPPWQRAVAGEAAAVEPVSEAKLREATDLLRAAAAQGLEPARSQLIGLSLRKPAYLESLVSQSEGLALVTAAAEAGSPKAALMLAGLYDRGSGGVAQDLELAFHWFERAYRSGVTTFPSMLASRYYQGRGTTRDVGRGDDCWEQPGFCAARSGLG